MLLQRLYNSQEEAFKAINNDTFKTAESDKRLMFIKANLGNITSINGTQVSGVNLVLNNLEWNNNLFCRPVIYLDVEFKD